MPRHRIPPQKLGSLIGAAFGAVFVVVNSASSPTVVRVLLCVAAAAAVALILVLLARIPAPPVPATVAPFGAGYWAIVVVEFAALFAGVRLLAGPLGRPEAGVAWVALVVGVHFLVLARYWHLERFTVLGAALTTLGVIGAVLAFAGAETVWVDLVAGVGSGAVLLTAALHGARGR